MKKIFSSVFLLFLLITVSFAQNKNDPQLPAARLAVSYGLVVDNSGSYRRLLERVINLTKNIIEENRADDEAFLVRFINSDKIHILQEFTGDKELLHEAAEEMFVEGGLTAILDAVLASARYLAEKANGESNRRKVLILITDGDERQSNVKIDEVIKFLKAAEIKVFAVVLSDEKVSHKVLDKLTRETGGRKFVPKTGAELPGIIKTLTTVMRAQ